MKSIVIATLIAALSISACTEISSEPPSTSGVVQGVQTAGYVQKWDGSADTDSTIVDDGYTTTFYAAGQPGQTQGVKIRGANASTTTQLFVKEDDTMHTAYEAIGIVDFQQATFDTTAAPATAWGIDAEAFATRVAGSNLLTQAAFHCNASGADANWCLLGEAGGGKINIPDGAELGPTNISSLNISALNINTNKVTFSSTGDVVIASGGSLTANGNVIFKPYGGAGGVEAYYGDPASGNSVYMASWGIGAAYDSNAADSLDLNFHGYQNASTRTRDIRVWDGEETLFARFVGSTKSLWVTNSIGVGGAAGPTWRSGAGAPSGACTIGSLYSNTSGGATTTLYVCTGSSTWTAK